MIKMSKKKCKKQRFFSFFGMLLLGAFMFYPTNVVFAEPQAAAQQESRIITGRVVDEVGEPLIGVTVTVRGTGQGVITDIDGNYSIRVQGNNQVLYFSFVGFNTQTQPANRSVINVVLTEDLGVLGEVVVVGFGAQRRANLTGAVSSVDVERTLSDRPIGDVGRMLQGTVPGLNISVPTGELGADAVMNIRGGFASFQPGATPLIMLDGVEIPNLTLVNPDDIESISVLRDAAASSIFGTRAAFGVILITTRRGAATDRVNVSYSNFFAWSSRATPLNMATMDGVEYAWAAAQRVGNTATGWPISINAESIQRTREHYARYGIMSINEPYTFGRDWFVSGGTVRGVRLFDPLDHIIQDWTPSQSHNLTVSGRSGNTQYHVALGVVSQQGLLRTADIDDFTRYNASTRITTKLHDRVTFRSGFLYSQRVRRDPHAGVGTSDPWLSVYRWGPLYPFGFDQHGNELRGMDQEVRQANTRVRQSTFMNYNVGLTIDLTNNWNIVADYTYTQETMLWNRPGTRFFAVNTWGITPLEWRDEDGNRVFVNREGQVVPAGTPGAEAGFTLPLPSTYTGAGSALDGIRRDSRHHQMHTANIFTTYNLRLQDIHDFTFMAGTNIVASNGMSHWVDRRRLLNLDNPSFDRATGTGDDLTGGGMDWWSSQLGFFGRINYVLNSRYLFEVNLRSDGSSNFPSHLQWHWFPSASAGWIVTEEKFMEGLQPYLSFLRPRVSFGAIGNQNVPNTIFLPTMANVANSGWLRGSTQNLMIRPPGLWQDDITWETIRTLNFGLDARFFNNRLGVAGDWYQRDNINAIVTGPVLPLTAGAGAPQGNFAQLRTRGWELAIDYTHRFRNGLSINMMGTFSDDVTYIHDFPEAIRSTANWNNQRGAFFKGQRIGNIWGYQTDGLFQWSDFAVGHDGNLQQVWVHPQTGNVRFQSNTPNNPGGYVLMNKLIGTQEGLLANNPLPNGLAYAPILQNHGLFMFGPGDVRYRDRTGSGLVGPGAGTVDDPGDMVVIGNSLPRFNYGFRFGADFRGFDFSMFWQGVGRRHLWGDGALAVPGYNASDGSMPQAIAGDFWSETNTNAFWPRPFDMTLTAGGATDIANYHRSDRFLLNMAYLRLKNITFGYSLPQDILRPLHISRARVHVSLENFLTFDRLRGLPIDPETVPGHNWDGGGAMNFNRVGVGTPMMRQAAVGLQITL